jgi:hypothetical protein
VICLDGAKRVDIAGEERLVSKTYLNSRKARVLMKYASEMQLWPHWRQFSDQIEGFDIFSSLLQYPNNIKIGHALYF